MAILGVNIDHVATVREARKTNEPDPVWAAALAELGGADAITVHLREDRRQSRTAICAFSRKRSLFRSISNWPAQPKCSRSRVRQTPSSDTSPRATRRSHHRRRIRCRRLEIKIRDAVRRLKDAGIVVSLFLDPDPRQLDAGIELGVDAIELHTGAYAQATLVYDGSKTDSTLKTLIAAAQQIRDAGVTLNAGHGLTYRNVKPVAAIEGMHELNIGHSIIARAMMVGLQQAVAEMKRLIS